MKILKDRAIAIIVMGAILFLFICLAVLARFTWIPEEYFFIYETPMFLDGEYSVDGGEWKPINEQELKSTQFDTILFKGKIKQIPYMDVLGEIAIFSQNVWYRLYKEDGEELAQNLPYYSQETLDYLDTMDEEVAKAYRLRHAMSMRNPETPGYSSFGMLIEDRINFDETLILEVTTPYPNRIFSECMKFSMNEEKGAYLSIVKKMKSLVLFLMLCLCGIILFPLVSFVFGKMNYRYLSFGILCFLLGAYMQIQILSFGLNLWFFDTVFCLMLDKLFGYFFLTSVYVYFRSNMNMPDTRAIAGIAVAVYALAVIMVSVLQFNGTADLIITEPFMQTLTVVITILEAVLLIVEIRRHKNRSTLVFLISCIPLVFTILTDILTEAWLHHDFHYSVYGIVIAMVVQGIRIAFDLRAQYREAIRYQQMQKELYETKVSVMISQVQPHFMYNALTSIAMMCTIDPQKAQEATITFAKYLRGNMDSLKQKTPVPFVQELEHLKKYLYIEKMRFANKLNIEYDITAENFVLPQLSIQPLVENAVKHGVGMKKKGGTVTISTKETETDYEVIISDDGVGFDTSAPRKEDGRSHIGMENTRLRLKELCGGDVRIESTIGEGTTATVILPKEGQPHENTVS